MSLIVRKPEGGDFEPVASGMNPAVCTRIYDLGSHYSEAYNKTNKKVCISWEIPGQRIEWEGENMPRMLSRIYTQSLHKKANLRIALESWRSKEFTPEELEGFDLKNILAKPCTLQVIHKVKDDRTFANIQNVLPATQKLTPENETVFFSLDDGVPIPESTPDWIKEMIEASNEWQTKEDESLDTWQDPDGPGSGPFPGVEDDEIPF